MTGVGDDDVAGLHVAVDDAVLVGERQRRRDLRADGGGLFGRESAVLEDELADGRTLDVLHDDEVRLALFAPVVDRDDVGMVQVRGRPRLPSEALDEGVVGGELRKQHFERDGPVEQLVMGEIDLRHPAARDMTDDFVAIAEDLFGHWRSLRCCQGRLNDGPGDRSGDCAAGRVL